jgi:2-iminobutanoate/2-iminopropanoate deaminase
VKVNPFTYICFVKKVIYTESAPAPIGPYSQAIASNGMVYISGQIAIVPATGNLAMDSIEVETEQVMDNLAAILSEANSNFGLVIKTTILLSDMSLFATVNEIYGKRFIADPPARETFAVKELPKGVNVEISMIALEK